MIVCQDCDLKQNKNIKGIDKHICFGCGGTFIYTQGSYPKLCQACSDKHNCCIFCGKVKNQ